MCATKPACCCTLHPSRSARRHHHFGHLLLPFSSPPHLHNLHPTVNSLPSAHHYQFHILFRFVHFTYDTPVLARFTLALPAISRLTWPFLSLSSTNFTSLQDTPLQRFLRCHITRTGCASSSATTFHHLRLDLWAHPRPSACTFRLHQLSLITSGALYSRSSECSHRLSAFSHPYHACNASSRHGIDSISWLVPASEP